MVVAAIGSERVQLELFQAEEASGIVLAGGVLGVALAEVCDSAVTGVEAVVGTAGGSEFVAGVGADGGSESGVGAFGQAGAEVGAVERAEAGVGAVEKTGTEAGVGAVERAGTEAGVGAGVGEGVSKMDNQLNADCDACDCDVAACRFWMCPSSSARKTRTQS